MGASKPTAAWPLPALVTSLSNAGWGSLDGRRHAGLRSVLIALEHRLPHKSAAGKVTVLQIADTAGLSERWTRRCLTALEDLGIIRWHRGTVSYGGREASHITVVKTVLVRLIRVARGEMTRRMAERKRAFDARLQRLRKVSLPRYQRQNAGDQAALSASLTPLTGEEPGWRSAPRKGRRPKPQRLLQWRERTVYERPPAPDPGLMPTWCPHAESSQKRIIYSCPDCRRVGIPSKEYAEWESRRMAEERPRASADSDVDPEAADHARMLAARYPGLSIVEATRRYLQELRTA